MSESKAMILGLAGTQPSAAEAAFFRAERPWGFILFARNVADRDQLCSLTQALRNCVGREDVPILIDQEGGRVQRLRPPLAPRYPTARSLGALYGHDRRVGLRAVWLMSRLHAFDLRRYGITVNCLPLLDIPALGSHDVIGDRAYGEDVETVTVLGRAAMDGLIAGGVLPVVKHVPGHGRATADSHLELPTVSTEREKLEKTDFVPFRALREAPLAMTAHVIYDSIDPVRPATTSPVVIGDIVRAAIGFDGLLMSDDVSMKALSGAFSDRCRAIFEAGCDVVLHCNGDMAEMEDVAAATPVLAGASLRRAEAALEAVGAPDETVEDMARREFDALTGFGRESADGSAIVLWSE